MSLLDHEGDPFDLEPDAVGSLRSATDSPLMEEFHRPRERKERRGKTSDDSARKGSSLSLRRGVKGREKEGEKTPKKSKHQTGKADAKTPPLPDSPKVPVLGGVAKWPAPSPSTAKRSKRYSQLGGDDISSDEEENGYFASNRSTQPRPPTPPPASPPASPTSPIVSSASFFPTQPALVPFPVQFPVGNPPPPLPHSVQPVS